MTVGKMEVSITDALRGDIPVFAEISRVTHISETISHFIFSDWHDKDVMLRHFTTILTQRFENPDTRVLKATDLRTNQILGFICWTLEHEDQLRPNQGHPVAAPTREKHQQSAGINTKFTEAMGRTVEALKKKHMTGTKHYCK